MKYYYNGIKVRTSDNKYTHAVVIGNSVVACCGREDLAIKRAHQEVINRTKNYMSSKCWFEKHPQELTPERAEWLKRSFELIGTIRVVELEVKA